MVIFRKPVAGASERSLARFVARARRAVGARAHVTVVVAGNRELRDLNRRFRGQDKPTDVLSFPGLLEAGEDGEGDIAISAEFAAANARRLGHRPADELKILVLHGLLHLAGFDHETDDGRMARKEARLRRELRLPQSLIERNAPLASRRVRSARVGGSPGRLRKNSDRLPTRPSAAKAAGENRLTARLKSCPSRNALNPEIFPRPARAAARVPRRQSV